MNIFDLQIQTTASDGRHSPTEIIAMAKEENLSVIAITDHDTIGGVGEALDAALRHQTRHARVPCTLTLLLTNIHADLVANATRNR